ncbi:MAG: hypothetical protein O9302_01100 [Cyclobacteriaceae bacterium]|jgi:hypothetical protein|nr:hypothetical protein [Flammeovirgaceae bacterium]MCZ8022322.1 hypothetical protein [Cytophagales bacterium]MCZ8326627.1 hypothetical protein [Cyclobacteriaceae bacterium]
MNSMKRLAWLFVAGLTAGLVSCGGGSDPKPINEVKLSELSKTWELTEAKLDGTTRNDFQNVTLTISGSFNAANPLGPYNFDFIGSFPNPSPWPTNGQWSFSDDKATTLVRTSDSQVIQYAISGNNLTLTIAGYSGAGFTGGPFTRTKAVTGTWIFSFEAQ